ncbi:MAG TPA: methyltransferase domain-containing protein [Kofleriaceae bacterium]|nr:methyltransferase domain-containing protein [Kofleriaceae bacterium]
MKTLIFIPTYDQRDRVASVCARIQALALDADVVTQPGAHHDAIAYAYDHGYDRLVTLDCDLAQVDVLPALIERARSADVVIGSRRVDKLVGRADHFMTEAMLGIHHDATSPVRAYNLHAIPREVFELAQSRDSAFLFESLFILHKNGFAIAEVPVAGARSKVSLRELQRSARKLGSIFLASQTNPTRFRLARDAARIDPDLVDPQNWNEYWAAHQRKTTPVYHIIATLYRNAIIKRNLQTTIRREFAPGSAILHAGCGSGQVDSDLHDHVKIIAVDIATSALDLYLRENPRGEVRHASIFELPFPDGSFDGVYNLGVVEHFTREELGRMFREFMRVLKPGGKFVIFWPHAYATSVAVLKVAHFVLNDVLHKDVRFHPPEVSLVHSSREAAALLGEAGFELDSYSFGPKDFWVQAIVVAKKPASVDAVSRPERWTTVAAGSSDAATG